MKLGILACFLAYLVIQSNIVGIATATLLPIFTPSDDNGPAFREVRDTSVDVLQHSNITHITLELYINAHDVMRCLVSLVDIRN